MDLRLFHLVLVLPLAAATVSAPLSGTTTLATFQTSMSPVSGYLSKGEIFERGSKIAELVRRWYI